MDCGDSFAALRLAWAWTIIERNLLYLGGINDRQRASWRKSIEVFGDGERRPLTVAIFSHLQKRWRDLFQCELRGAALRSDERLL